MIRIFVAMTVAVACVSAANAESKHRWQKRAVSAAPSQLAPGQIYPNRPAWAPPGICFTDEGYGRYLECGMGGRGG
jgi:hypothetical protein